MDNTKLNLSAMSIALVGFLTFFGLILALQRVDTYLRIKAVDECGLVSRFETNASNGDHTSVPIADSYNACLKDKGF